MSASLTTNSHDAMDSRAERAQELRVLLVLSALMSFASIATDIYLPAFPTIQRALHGGPGDIEFTLSSFLAGFGIGQLLWGPLGDRHGRRLPIAVGLALFIVGSIGCASSTTVLQLTAWRVVQALGACAGPVLARAMARDLYRDERAAQMLSTLIFIMMAAPLLGPLLGGQLLAVWSWQGIFWTMAALGVLGILALYTLPETLPVAQRARGPLRDVFATYLALSRNRRLMGFALSGACFYAGMYVFIAASPSVYIETFDVPAQRYGLLFGVNILGMMATNFLNSRLVMHVGSERLFHYGVRALAVSGVVLAINVQLGLGGLWGVVLPVFCFSAMNGLVVANSVAGALAEAPERTGAASSFVGAMQYGSGVASALLVGWLADGTARPMACLMAAAGVSSVVLAHFVRRVAAPQS